MVSFGSLLLMSDGVFVCLTPLLRLCFDVLIVSGRLWAKSRREYPSQSQHAQCTSDSECYKMYQQDATQSSKDGRRYSKEKKIQSGRSQMPKLGQNQSGLNSLQSSDGPSRDEKRRRVSHHTVGQVGPLLLPQPQNSRPLCLRGCCFVFMSQTHLYQGRSG